MADFRLLIWLLALEICLFLSFYFNLCELIIDAEIDGHFYIYYIGCVTLYVSSNGFYILVR